MTLCILAFYTDQLRKLKGSGPLQRLQEQLFERRIFFQVLTADSYQRQESDIVFLTLSRSGNDSIGFCNNRRRNNVSISRAKSSLYIFGDQNLFSNDPTWFEILKHIESENSHTMPHFQEDVHFESHVEQGLSHFQNEVFDSHMEQDPSLPIHVLQINLSELETTIATRISKLTVRSNWRPDEGSFKIKPTDLTDKKDTKRKPADWLEVNGDEFFNQDSAKIIKEIEERVLDDDDVSKDILYARGFRLEFNSNLHKSIENYRKKFRKRGAKYDGVDALVTSLVDRGLISIKYGQFKTKDPCPKKCSELDIDLINKLKTHQDLQTNLTKLKIRQTLESFRGTHLRDDSESLKYFAEEVSLEGEMDDEQDCTMIVVHDNKSTQIGKRKTSDLFQLCNECKMPLIIMFYGKC